MLQRCCVVWTVVDWGFKVFGATCVLVSGHQVCLCSSHPRLERIVTLLQPVAPAPAPPPAPQLQGGRSKGLHLQKPKQEATKGMLLFVHGASIPDKVIGNHLCYHYIMHDGVGGCG